ncbi:metal-dependent hydrolase [Novimethylophilus kurashikiensis]|uniref:Metal-dependent hydrolase n=1 Tax=Novimethylophilus kurashikiensis TaxID=1825523 RepID=A0A2R5F447_9PROT|nr:HDOD domain-containing protein [Novimethylophilus kurashikiensis]GBG13025.1 metal-dependent hydrolase [Novimethylophilus kurashikiensis]
MSSLLDDARLQQLTKQEFPVLDATRKALQALSSRAKTSAADIAAVILADPMMTLNLLRQANARRGGEFDQRIATVEHAVMLLGFSNVFERLTRLPAVEEVIAPDHRGGLLKAVTLARHSAYLAREWAMQRLDIAPEEVYVAGLLHNMAEIGLWVTVPELVSNEIDSWFQTLSGTFEEAWLKQARNLGEMMHLPPLVVGGMALPSDDPAHRPALVFLANRIVRNADRGWWHPEIQQDLELASVIRRQTPDETVVQVHRCMVEAARRHPFADVTPPAAWLPMLEGDWPELQQDDALADAHAKSAFETVMEQIRSKSEGEISLSELLSLVVRGMHEGIGLNRIVFALLAKDNTTLTARYVFGATSDSPLKKFQFGMQQRHLFSILMGKPQAVWVSDETRQRYAPVMTPDIETTTSGRDFFAMSLSVQSKVVGLFYADRDQAELDAAGYEQFKQISLLSAQLMSRLSKAKPATV